MHRVLWRLLASAPLLVGSRAAAAPAAGSSEPATASAPAAEPVESVPRQQRESGSSSLGLATAASDPGMVGERREPVMLSNAGATGLFHAVLPDAGAPLTLRFRLFSDFFRREGFIYDSNLGSDRHTRVRSGISLGFTPARWAELALTVRSAANRNARPQPGRQDRETQFSVGDVDLVAKGLHRFTQYGLGVGGQLGLGLLSGSQRLFAAHVNFWFDGLLALDLRYLTAQRLPIRFATNLGWILDNSRHAVDLSGFSDPISREVARFGTNGNNNRLRMRYAVDFPLRLGARDQFGLDPILEWSWDIATSRQSMFAIDGTEASRLPRTSQWVTLGVRSNVIAGLFLDVALDVGVVSPSFEFGPPTPPWQFMFGIGYAFDPRPVVREVEIIKPAPPPEPAPPILDRRIIGTVLDPDGQPIPRARIAFPGRPLNHIVTDQTGSFASYRFAPGDIQLQVLLDDAVVYEGIATVTDERDTELTIALEQLPGPPTGTVRGAFVDADGNPVRAQVHIVGPEFDERLTASEAGLIATELVAGTYTATVAADGFVTKKLEFEVAEDGEVELQETLTVDRPPDPKTIRVRRGRIRLRGGIRYVGDDLSPRSHAILDDLAVYLKNHPELGVIEIGVHTDDRGAPQQRSDNRARAVERYLVEHGVDANRIRARGYGASYPIAVNLTPSGRRKNNRTIIRVADD